MHVCGNKHVSRPKDSNVLAYAYAVTNVKTNRLSSLMQTLSSLSHYENNMKMMPILLKDDIFLEKLNLSNNMKAKQTHTAILTQYLDFLYEVQKYEKILHEVDILSGKLDNPLVSISSEILTL